MAQRGKSSEKIKRNLLAGLGGLFVVVFVYEMFFSGTAPKPKLNPQAGASNSNTALPATASAPVVPQKRPTGAAAEQEAQVQALLSDLTPLNLRIVSNGGGKSDPGPRQNIFAYYVEPPKPAPPPPPPPPIQLTVVQPASLVAGTPRAVTVLVSGNKIPADAQIFFNGGLRPTKRVSETQLSTEVSAQDYSSPQQWNIDVKSKSNPAENSNSLMLVVQALPEPAFIYKGRLGALNQPQTNFAVFELNSTKEMKRAKVGDTVMGVWRVDSISADSVEVTNTQYEIKKRLPLLDKQR